MSQFKLVREEYQQNTTDTEPIYENFLNDPDIDEHADLLNVNEKQGQFEERYPWLGYLLLFMIMYYMANFAIGLIVSVFGIFLQDDNLWMQIWTAWAQLYLVLVYHSGFQGLSYNLDKKLKYSIFKWKFHVLLFSISMLFKYFQIDYILKDFAIILDFVQISLFGSMAYYFLEDQFEVELFSIFFAAIIPIILVIYSQKILNLRSNVQKMKKKKKKKDI